MFRSVESFRCDLDIIILHSRISLLTGCKLKLPSLFTEELCELTISRRGKKWFSCLLTMPIQDFQAPLSTAKPQTPPGLYSHRKSPTCPSKQSTFSSSQYVPMLPTLHFLRNFDGLTRLAPALAHFEP